MFCLVVFSHSSQLGCLVQKLHQCQVTAHKQAPEQLDRKAKKRPLICHCFYFCCFSHTLEIASRQLWVLRGGSVEVMMRTVSAGLRLRHNNGRPLYPPDLQARSSYVEGGRLFCHIYSHHIKSSPNFSSVVIAKVSLDSTVFIRQLRPEIVVWTDDCFLNVTLVCYADILLIGRAKHDLLEKNCTLLPISQKC